MTAATAANKPFTAIPHELADIEKINGKVFTMNMVYTYSLIEGYQSNGQTAYFSQDRLKRRLGITTPTVVKLIRDMVAMGLINKTAQIGGKTCHYTVNPITPEMVGTPGAAKPELPTVETVENAGTYQPGAIECGSESSDVGDAEPDRIIELDDHRIPVQPLVVYDTVTGEIENDNPDVGFIPDSVVCAQLKAAAPLPEVTASAWWDEDPAF